MITVPIPIPTGLLDEIEVENLVVQAEKDHIVAYFDFDKILFPHRQETSLFFDQIKCPPVTPSESLSFSGWVGFWGYEFLASNLGVELHAVKDLNLPDGWFGRPRSLIRFFPDHTIIESLSSAREQELKSALGSPKLPSTEITSDASRHPIACNLDFGRYKEIFSQAREAILDGETYQIKISQRFEDHTQISPLHAFLELRKSNPAPEAFLLQTPDFAIISCSPEVVIEKKGSQITTRPIGGTYQRDHATQDGSVIECFLRDSKEVAEHNMLVDLERNDLSTICLPGTVQIDRFREVESYSHLHHLVSTISGTLQPHKSLQDIIRAMLPGGSITGCPKIRTMEWIDRLEPCFRGPYTGSFGTIEDGGNIRLNLIIRSMIRLQGKAYVQAGGGIVVESTPEYEFNENQIKAQALLDLLQ
ncbi:MAG: anthranilate synthase component I family protein [Opitutales bacterium]|nr:anthranilate synthase component I family protein [Opitutales bacterium]